MLALVDIAEASYLCLTCNDFCMNLLVKIFFGDKVQIITGWLGSFPLGCSLACKKLPFTRKASAKGTHHG